MNSKKESAKQLLKTVTAAADRISSDGFFGCVEGLKHSNEITGWAVDASDTGRMLSIGIYADDELLGRAYCTENRADIAALLGRTAKSGFTYPVALLEIPARLQGEQAESIPLVFKIEDASACLPFLPGQEVDLKAVGAHMRAKSVPQSETQIRAEVDRYVEELALPATSDAKVKAIAFYLPQYHPVPENDEWWGPGFTEWTNVTQARPAFQDHYQPRIPGELGFYDLRLAEVREAQARLAREHGIHGFCYYYYWFAGRRILERPLNDMLSSGSPDFPFCICWANETWSRRWDGSEHEVLLKQEHTKGNDIAFIRDVIPILKDPRYITIAGAPLLLIYRTTLFPDMKATADVWRRICAEEGLPHIHLCAVESFGFNDPYSIGFDSSVQFPPHGISASEIAASLKGLDKDFEGHVFDYEEVVQNELVAPQPGYKRYRGVMLSWDNSARRKNKAHMFHKATPAAYELWMRAAVQWTRGHHVPQEQLVFINAWNEWAEGTHLEPDVKHGRAYLEATMRALSGLSEWQTLIQYAQAKGGLSGDDLHDWLAEIQARFAHAERIEAHAQRLISRNHGLTDGGTVMSDTVPYMMDFLPLVPAARANFDRIGALAGDMKVVVVRRSADLFVEGWCVHPEVEVGNRTVSYLVMESLKGKGRNYAPIFGRQVREDVVVAFSGLSASSTRYSGFRAYVDITRLEPGEYRIGIVQVAAESFSLNYADGVIRVV